MLTTYWPPVISCGLNSNKPIFAVNFSNIIFHKLVTANNSYLIIFVPKLYFHKCINYQFLHYYTAIWVFIILYLPDFPSYFISYSPFYNHLFIIYFLKEIITILFKFYLQRKKESRQLCEQREEQRGRERENLSRFHAERRAQCRAWSHESVTMWHNWAGPHNTKNTLSAVLSFDLEALVKIPFPHLLKLLTEFSYLELYD